MGQIKNRLLFFGITCTAYISPLFMIISLSTNFWLFSTEKIQMPKNMNREKAAVTTLQPTTVTTVSAALFTAVKPLPNNYAVGANDLKKHSKNISLLQIPKFELTTKQSIVYAPSEYTEANYGLWRMCKIIGCFLKS